MSSKKYVDDPSKESHPMAESDEGRGTSMYKSKESKRKTERQLKGWRIAAVVFVVISLVLLATIIALAVTGKSMSKDEGENSKANTGELKEKEEQDSKECSITGQGITNERLLRGNKVFGGLTPNETGEVVKFMMNQKDLDLKKAATAKLNENYIYSIEEELPPKVDVLKWLDGNNRQSQPERKARVLLFLGKTRTIREYLVSPIPTPRRKEKVSTGTSGRLTWRDRPISNTVEMPAVYKSMTEQLKDISGLLQHSFAPDCDDFIKCFFMNIAPRVVIGSPDRHLVGWFVVSPHQIEDYYVYPLPFYIIFKTRANGLDYEIVKLYYNGKPYDSAIALKDAYFAKDSLIKYTLPDLDKQRGLYGSPQPTKQGNTIDRKRRPPQQYYPDGPRFNVSGSTVEWLGWSFNIHPRTIAGMQLFNVQYKNERIAYELSMQDIVVMYSGGPPDDYFKNYVDNGWSTGAYNFPLIRGVDCPTGAVYLDSNVFSEGKDKGIVMKDAICVFEHRNSIPLRRHFSSNFAERGYRYAFSMPDTVLVVRQILTIWNYDYIFDYEFHQNGVIEVKASSTGYVALTNNLDGSTISHGYIINDHWKTTANLHQHIFNFKLDLDIGGRKNNFKTVDIKEQFQKTEFSGTEAWYQMVMSETMIDSESDAALSYSFDKPKFYIMYDDAKTKQRGYRILSNSFNYVTLPESSPFKKGLSWTKYQLAVTKYNESERTTASQFVQGDPFNPPINFDEFLENDDNLRDEDLVAWVTVGIHHAPTYEDLPITTTPGKTVSIVLSPFNYFKRDPSINSRDAAVFWNKSFNKSDDYFYQEDKCSPHHHKPTIHH